MTNQTEQLMEKDKEVINEKMSENSTVAGFSLVASIVTFFVFMQIEKISNGGKFVVLFPLFGAVVYFIKNLIILNSSSKGIKYLLEGIIVRKGNYNWAKRESTLVYFFEIKVEKQIFTFYVNEKQFNNFLEGDYIKVHYLTQTIKALDIELLKGVERIA